MGVVRDCVGAGEDAQDWQGLYHEVQHPIEQQIYSFVTRNSCTVPVIFFLYLFLSCAVVCVIATEVQEISLVKL